MEKLVHNIAISCHPTFQGSHLGGSAFCNFRLGVSEQALGGISVGFEIDKPEELVCEGGSTVQRTRLMLHLVYVLTCILQRSLDHTQRGGVWGRDY